MGSNPSFTCTSSVNSLSFCFEFQSALEQDADASTTVVSSVEPRGATCRSTCDPDRKLFQQVDFPSPGLVPAPGGFWEHGGEQHAQECSQPRPSRGEIFTWRVLISTKLPVRPREGHAVGQGPADEEGGVLLNPVEPVSDGKLERRGRRNEQAETGSVHVGPLISLLLRLKCNNLPHPPRMHCTADLCGAKAPDTFRMFNSNSFHRRASETAGTTRNFHGRNSL